MDQHCKIDNRQNDQGQERRDQQQHKEYWWRMDKKKKIEFNFDKIKKIFQTV